MLGIVMISWISTAQGANLSEICNHPPMFLSDVLCESVMIALFHLFMSNDVNLCFKWESWSSKMKSCDVIHREADLCYIISSSHGWGSGRPLKPLHPNEYTIQIFRQSPYIGGVSPEHVRGRLAGGGAGSARPPRRTPRSRPRGIASLLFWPWAGRHPSGKGHIFRGTRGYPKISWRCWSLWKAKVCVSPSP